jgi:Ala-tRNA(Pro) deacylase
VTAETSESRTDDTTYHKLIRMLDEGGATYRLIHHEPEGRTEIVSAMRGHDPAAAAKCIIVRVKLGKKTSRYLLAVVPGHRRVDMERVKSFVGGTYASFATAETAESLAGSVSGTILPFAFHEDLELVVDPELLGHSELYFNAARLDQSLALRTEDYVALAKPTVLPIAE